MRSGGAMGAVPSRKRGRGTGQTNPARRTSGFDYKGETCTCKGGGRKTDIRRGRNRNGRLHTAHADAAPFLRGGSAFLASPGQAGRRRGVARNVDATRCKRTLPGSNHRRGGRAQRRGFPRVRRDRRRTRRPCGRSRAAFGPTGADNPPAKQAKNGLPATVPEARFGVFGEENAACGESAEIRKPGLSLSGAGGRKSAPEKHKNRPAAMRCGGAVISEANRLKLAGLDGSARLLGGVLHELDGDGEDAVVPDDLHLDRVADLVCVQRGGHVGG